MRDIKFRGWDEELKIMVYDTELTGHIEYDTNPVEVVNSILNEDDYGLYFMQFTGLYDRKGKEIYEGDIIKSENDLILIRCVTAGFRPFRKKDGKFKKQTNWQHTKNGEVVGNIFENPELLKEV